jgi:prevent-host-death family protein
MQISAREFNNDLAAAKRHARLEPVIITDRGKPAYVLMSMAEYERLSGPPTTIGEALRMDEDIPFDPPRLNFEPRVPDL